MPNLLARVAIRMIRACQGDFAPLVAGRLPTIGQAWSWRRPDVQAPPVPTGPLVGTA